MTPGRSPVWHHFKKISEKQVQCNICKDKLVYCTSTSAMLKHMKHKHPHILSKNVEDDPDDPAPKQPKLTQFGIVSGRSCNASRQEEITKRIALMIAKHSAPMHMVEWEGFREVVSYMEPNYRPVSYETIKVKIEEKSAELKVTIKSKMNCADYIALTTDAWTSLSNDSYLAVTASFLSAEFVLHSPVLETVMLTDRHTSVYLEEVIKNVLQEWDINDKVVAIVHDNASNIKQISKHLNIGVDVSCAAHTLQLCINEAMGTNTQVSNHVIARTINAASCLVGHFNHSTQANNELRRRQVMMEPDKPARSLIQYCRTRWNSILEMLQRIQDLKWPIAAVLSDTAHTKAATGKSLQLTTEQMNIIEGIIPVLQSLKTANNYFCGEKYATLSLVYPTMYALLNVHLCASDGDSTIVKRFKLDLINHINRRFFTNVNPVVAMAAAIDPRFKHLDLFDKRVREITEGEVQKLIQRTDAENARVKVETNVDQQPTTSFFGIRRQIGTSSMMAAEYKK